jgi:FlaA1/EpsC-like NDP-sugar epimerase
MIDYISNLNRFSKQVIVLLIDIVFCLTSLYLAYYLRVEQFIEFDQSNIRFFLISFVIFIPTFIVFGLYSTIFRYSGQSTYFRVAYAVLFYTVTIFIILNFIQIENIPRSSVIIQAPIFIIFIVFFRLIIKFVFSNNNNESKINSIAILGDSNELFNYIPFLEKHFNIKIIFDINNKNLGRKVYNYQIQDPNNLLSFLKKINVYKLFIIKYYISEVEKENYLKTFYNTEIVLKFLPPLKEFLYNPSIPYLLKKINFEDIIKNKIMYDFNSQLLPVFQNKTILVTGAGGSIGSQLCKEIIKYKINTIILLDHSEYNLYEIQEYLINLKINCKIISILGSITNYSFLLLNLIDKKIDYIFHSAAYKHVPLLEKNSIEGVKNNIIGTYNIAKISSELSINNTLLVSTDKAVNPTNIMGATKRVSENIFQAFENKFPKLNYNIVRFGNVVNSKGSVLPNFSYQIENRLPLQLTHMEVERYFMTIPDAAKLIIEISSRKISKVDTGIYFLDMGKSLKILDLIKLILKVNNLKLKKNEFDLEGDIDLNIIGLRPGEKIKEELSINKDYKITEFNKQIYICKETFISYDQIENEILELKKLINNNQFFEIIKFLEKRVEGFRYNL